MAPEMHGYGRFASHSAHGEDWSSTASRTDALNLLVHLGRDGAIRVGHDWGSYARLELRPAHGRCQTVARLCVPYILQPREI